MSAEHLLLLQQEVVVMLQKGAIELVPVGEEGTGVYSLYFLIPKKDGSLRPILDLRPLNLYILSEHFHMLTLQQILPLLNQGDFLATLDLKDAYFHIPLHPSHRKYLRFTIQGRHYQFKVLPFGVTTAPRVFTKCLATVAAHLRRQNIHVYPYLDDWLVQAKSEHQCAADMSTTIHLLHDLGFSLNYPKSHLQPAHVRQFLGATINTLTAMAQPNQVRIDSMQALIQKFRPQHSLPARVFMQLIGMMASCIFIVPHARLHMRPLQECLANQWTQARGQLTDLVLVTSRAYDSLHWWTPHNLCKGRLFQEPVPQIILTTDASLQGWGAHVLTYTVQGLSVQQSRASPDGQHDRDVLHSKAGRHPLATAVSSGSEHVEVGHSEEHFPHGRTPPRKGQSDGGSAQQIQPSNARVGDTPVCSPPVLPAVGSSGDRPVCHSRERKMPTLCRQVPSPTVAGECDMDELVRQICVRFSASPSNTAGRKKAKAARDDSHPGCSNVGAPSLVHHVPRTLSGAASKAAPHAQSFDAEPWRHSASRSTTAQPGDLAPEVLEFGYLNLPPECMHIIKEAGVLPVFVMSGWLMPTMKGQLSHIVQSWELPSGPMT
ncbi:uncharacterized protein LOC144767313 [Lissotriton helveticus]